MNVRKLLNWRSLSIYSHRWLGIAIGIIFVTWCLSGVVLMYYGITTLKAGERLMRYPALDLSNVHLTPAEAAAKAELKSPMRLRISMQGDRPAYRFNTGRGFGVWTVVYADTGEKMTPMDAAGAMNWMRHFRPDRASSLRYDQYMKTADEFVRIPAMQGYLPMHRIALDDDASTEYYISEKTGEAVMKTDRWSRVWSFSGYTLHKFFWWRQKPWYKTLVMTLSWIGIAMCLTGLVVGIWRYGLTPRFRHKGVHSHSPYKGWMKWHHYAGLIFGLFSLTWVYSGLVTIPAAPGITETDQTYTKAQMAQGAFTLNGEPGPKNLEPITIDHMRQAAGALQATFPLKEMELIEVGRKSYFLAYKPAASDAEVDQWYVNNGLDFVAPMMLHEHAMVSATSPETGVFPRFDDAFMLEVAKDAMPDGSVQDVATINEYDTYYYEYLPGFHSGVMKPAKQLPAVRVKFNDPKETWLYLNSSLGQMVKVERDDRVNRWAYYALHALDFPGLFKYRPLWDIVTLTFLIGVTVLSFTTLVPMYRRLKRHAIHAGSVLAGKRRPVVQPAPQVTMSDVSIGKDV